MREVIEFDLDELDFKAALTGVIGLVIAAVLIGVFGPVGVAAGIAALFVIAGGADETGQPDAIQLGFIGVGALVTFVVGASSDSSVAASIVIAAITLAATLAAGWGRRLASLGVFAVLWAILALSIGETTENAASMALAFAAGGVIAMVATWIASFIQTDQDELDTDAPDDEQAGSASDSGPAMSTIAVFAIVRAVAVGACTYLGYWLFPEHTSWAALTFVLVVRPPKESVLAVGVGRTLGTAVGVVVGILVAQLVAGNDAAVVIAFVLSGFFMLATSGVNYALSTMFTTTLLLLAQQIGQDEVFSAGWQRLLATLLGVGVAFAAILVLRIVSQIRSASAQSQSTPGTAP